MRCRQRKELGGGEELLFLVINLASSAARRLPPAFLFPGSRGIGVGTADGGGGKLFPCSPTARG